MPHQRRPTRRRDVFATELAVALTKLWFGFAIMSPFLLGGFTLGGKSMIQISMNYPLLIATALIPAAAWWWVLWIRDGQRAAGKSLEELQALSPEAFEGWVAVRFRELGYKARVVGAQGDHGVDIVLEKPGEKAVVQCKNYRAWAVGEPILRDLFGAMHDFGADRAYLVTTGKLTGSALAWVDTKPIEIWDGSYLIQLSKSLEGKGNPGVVAPLQSSGSTNNGTETLRTGRNGGPLDRSRAIDLAGPCTMTAVCPKCGSDLVQRTNRRTGEIFLACPGYPTCRHTQPLR